MSTINPDARFNPDFIDGDKLVEDLMDWIAERFPDRNTFVEYDGLVGCDGLLVKVPGPKLKCGFSNNFRITLTPIDQHNNSILGKYCPFECCECTGACEIGLEQR